MVYDVPCEDCDQSYIGESGRSLEVRLAEHQRHVRKGDITRSAIAEHAILQVHRMDWESALHELLTSQKILATSCERGTAYRPA